MGLNPMVLATSDIVADLQAQLLPVLQAQHLQFDSVYFYGAGCAGSEAQEKMQRALRLALHSVSGQVEVASDIWAAIYAACGHKDGFCSILGTGSNSCFYDAQAQQIRQQIPAMGYLLGDEGSGVDMGRRFLQAYFYGQLPEEVMESAREEFPVLGQADFLSELYSSPRPNQFIAQFARALPLFEAHEEIQDLVEAALESFFRNRLLAYKDVRKHPHHFVGSIAFAWRGHLERLCALHDLPLGQILPDPFPNLWHYHQR